MVTVKSSFDIRVLFSVATIARLGRIQIFVEADVAGFIV
jgi:hypothetical protein